MRRGNYWGIINVDFDATGQLMIIHSTFIKYLKKKWEYNEAVKKKWEYNEAVHHLFIDFKKAYDSLEGRSCIIFSLSLISP